MIYIIIGTKAQLIKMAPVMGRLRDKKIPYTFINTGQHRATMDEMLDDFALKKPDVTLYKGPDIVSVFQMFSWSLKILWKSIFQRQLIFGKEKQGIVLVHGDTFSTLLGALMGRLAGFRVGHIESGLRSFNLFHPFPEEITRLLTFRLSHTLYCPGDWAMQNVASLQREKINIHSNTMADTLAMTLDNKNLKKHIPESLFGLVSLHRYENIFRKERLQSLVLSLEKIAVVKHLLFILHPPTVKQLHRFGFYERLAANKAIELRPRYPHSTFIGLLKAAEFVITDGGSMQEETSYLGIPCLLMRKATERQEGLGKNVVLSNYDEKILEEFIQNYPKYRQSPKSKTISPSKIIVESVRKYA